MTESVRMRERERETTFPQLRSHEKLMQTTDRRSWGVSMAKSEGGEREQLTFRKRQTGTTDRRCWGESAQQDDGGERELLTTRENQTGTTDRRS